MKQITESFGTIYELLFLLYLLVTMWPMRPMHQKIQSFSEFKSIQGITKIKMWLHKAGVTFSIHANSASSLNNYRLLKILNTD